LAINNRTRERKPNEVASRLIALIVLGGGYLVAEASTNLKDRQLCCSTYGMEFKPITWVTCPSLDCRLLSFTRKKLLELNPTGINRLFRGDHWISFCTLPRANIEVSRPYAPKGKWIRGKRKRLCITTSLTQAGTISRIKKLARAKMRF